MSPTQAPDKRRRLVDAATKLFYEQGFRRTTLAHIASEADVPVGNIYYYFKSKEAIGEAIVDQQLSAYRALRQEWDAQPDPRARLSSFVQMTLANRRQLARSGCPIGTLCSELHKERGFLAGEASRLLAEWLTWLEGQFRALGKGDDARGLAVHLLSVLQGATLLTHSFASPKYIEAEAARLTDWIRDL